MSFDEEGLERLRQDLMEHFGTSPFMWKLIAVARVESASYEDLVSLAQDEGFDLTKYTVT